MEKLSVVVVDDQPSICKEVASFLREGYDVHAFKGGREAIGYLETNHADLILLDYYMPEMTGFELMMQIRQNKSFDDTPIIFLTSETSERLEHEMEQRGANDYLCKPISKDELLACIEKNIKR
ncbi:MAG: response regulator [Defluviitaleaceae bacterium]|nr:response regulator [Defluviitaleaceae bacterium]